jgi:hypothetical protein
MSKLIEVRISDYEIEMLSLKLFEELKDMIREYGRDGGYDREYSYLWARFSPEQWMLVNVKFPQLTQHLHRIQ